jgi:outer membrane protein OmpA-like peptidoglycan-associated protein
VDRVGILASGLVKGRVHTFDATYTEPRIPYVKDAFIGARKTFVKEFEGQGSRYPVMAPNGQQVYYVRSSDETSDDAWFADALTDSTWTVGRSLGAPINNSGANNVISVSQDGNELMLYGVYNADGSSRGAGFSTSRRTSTGWSVPTDIASNHRTNRSRNREECVSADRSVMILARDLEGDTRGEKDLYVSFRQPDGSYGPCINLGSDVNSEAGENGPFLAADNRTLYWYSSVGGFGDADVFVSKRLDSTWQRWTPRTNLGPTINTGTWDAYFTIHPSGRYAYMNTSDGYRDGICRVDLPNDPASRALLPDPVVIVKGRVLHARTKQPLGVDIRYADLNTGAAIGSAVSEPKDGRYSVVLTGGRDYGFNAERAGFFPVSDFIRLEKLDQYQVVERDLLLEPIEVGATIRLNNLFFDTDKATLRPESFGELQRLIDLLQSRPTMNISIDGHTDDRGTKQHNATLSKARAATVRTYLIDKGIDASRLTSAGWGSERPLSKGTTDAIRQRNRRVEFTITAM